MDTPVSAVDVDQVVVDSPELGEVVASGLSTITSRFSPLSPRLSPVSMISVLQIVVEPPTSYEPPVGSKDVCPAADRVVPLLPQESQVSQLSSVQLSSNRVRANYDIDTMDVFPTYAVSPRNDGYVPSVSPISTPNALSKPGSPCGFEPVVEPEVMLLQPALAPVRPSHAPDLPVDPSPAVLSRERPFDAFTEPADTSDHPLISFGLTGCPYRMTTYREEDMAQMDTAFGMQLQLQLQDVLVAAMQLQQDAALMASNITVLSQYVTSLHRMSTEVMLSVYGREYFPSQSIDDAAPVPRVNRAYTQMAAMGLWRPPISPGGPGLITDYGSP